MSADREEARSAAYATDNGFYVGDRVTTPHNHTGFITEIVLPRVAYLTSFGVYHGSVVKVDGDELWIDGALTRVG